MSVQVWEGDQISDLERVQLLRTYRIRYQRVESLRGEHCWYWIVVSKIGHLMGGREESAACQVSFKAAQELFEHLSDIREDNGPVYRVEIV